jgi:hypothetical protein
MIETTDGTPSTITTTFNTYATLPTGSVSMPNIAQLYPKREGRLTNLEGGAVGELS